MKHTQNSFSAVTINPLTCAMRQLRVVRLLIALTPSDCRGEHHSWFVSAFLRDEACKPCTWSITTHTKQIKVGDRSNTNHLIQIFMFFFLTLKIW